MKKIAWILAVGGVFLPGIHAEGMEFGGFDVSVEEGAGEIPFDWESGSGGGDSQGDSSADISWGTEITENDRQNWNTGGTEWNGYWDDSQGGLGNETTGGWNDGTAGNGDDFSWEDQAEGSSWERDLSESVTSPGKGQNRENSSSKGSGGFRTEGEPLTDVPSSEGTAAPSSALTGRSSSSATVTPSPALTVRSSPSATVTPSPARTVTPSSAATITPSSAVTVTPSPAVTITPSSGQTAEASAPTVTPAPVLSFYRRHGEDAAEKVPLLVHHQKEETDACEVPGFLITGNTGVHILSVRINGDECPWHWQGHSLVIESSAQKETNCVELLALYEEGEEIQVKFQKGIS